jgi:hypothetical protein
MSAGKLLKIIDNELVRISNSPGEDILAIPDSFRHFTKRYYHNLVEKRTRGDIVVVKSAKRLIYGNNPPENVGAPNRKPAYEQMEDISDDGRIRYTNSRVSEVHFSEARERCTPNLYEKIQSVRMVGDESFFRGDEYWRYFILGSAGTNTTIPVGEAPPAPGSQVSGEYTMSPGALKWSSRVNQTVEGGAYTFAPDGSGYDASSGMLRFSVRADQVVEDAAGFRVAEYLGAESVENQRFEPSTEFSAFGDPVLPGQARVQDAAVYNLPESAQSAYEAGTTLILGDPVIKLDEVYYDHCFSLTLPHSDREVSLLHGSVGSVYGNVDYEYNFLQQEYEAAINSRNVSELILPNIYTVMSAFDEDNNISMSEYVKRHVTLNNNLPLPIYKNMRMSKFSGDKFTNNCTSVSPPSGMNIDYYRHWSNLGLPRYLNAGGTDQENQNRRLERRYSNILIPEKNIDIINTYNNNKELFPMYADISFTTDSATQIAEAFSNLNLNCALMKGMFQLLTKPIGKRDTNAGEDVVGEEPAAESGFNWMAGDPQFGPFVPDGISKVYVPGIGLVDAQAAGSSGQVSDEAMSPPAPTVSDDPPQGSYSGYQSGRFSKFTEYLGSNLGPQTIDDGATFNVPQEPAPVEVEGDDPCLPPSDMRLYAKTWITQADIPIPAENSTACNPKMRVKSTIRNQRYRMMDLNEWLNYFHADMARPFGASGLYFGFRQKGMDIAQNPTTEYEKNFLMTVLKSKVQTIVANNMRAYDDIFDGDMAYSETIMYRIAKYKGNETIPIQNYWISNSNKTDMLRFVDTQVKYDKEYRYTVFAYQVVLGTKYAYKNLAISKTITEDPKVCVELYDVKTGEPVPERVPFDNKRHPITKVAKMIPVLKKHRYLAEFDVVVRPSVKILEIPYMRFTSRIVDSPPMPPDINIVPYHNVKDKINIFMNNGTGERKLESIFIDRHEFEHMSKYRKAKGLIDGELVTYSSDDRPTDFIVYRTTNKPKSYADFRNKIHRRVSTAGKNIDIMNQHVGESPTKGHFSSIAFNDTISPNRKYYYTFKSKDFHGNLSNPSAVYEVEIVEEKGASYFLMQAVNFETIEPKQPTITGKRLLEIIPNINQRLINEEASGFEEVTSAKDLRDKVTLGLNKSPVWGKLFKFRLTSTKTGRKLDLNVRFITRDKRTGSDFEC